MFSPKDFPFILKNAIFLITISHNTLTNAIYLAKAVDMKISFTLL